MSHHRMFRKKEKGIVPMPKYVITLMLLCASLSTQVTRCNAAALHDEPQNSQESAANSVNPVVQWNRTLLVIVRTPGAQPATVHPTRSFAILHAAVYDAVNAIDRSHKPYFLKTPPVPGDSQSPPPNFPKQRQFPHWSHVTPFALERANQFRPGPPPVLTRDTYSDVFNEVKSLGIVNSTTATPDQVLTGRFWNGAIQNYWNEIAQTATLRHELTTAQSARLFALLNLSFADGVIAFYDAKYTYNFWRPVTAIREAATSGNPKTVPDLNWLPGVGNTTPDPSYPGAHAIISAAGASILISFFRENHFDFSVTSEVLPGVERSFDSFSAAGEEATLSRIFAGVHFRPDLTSGQRLGREVADFVVDNFLTPLHEREDDK